MITALEDRAEALEDQNATYRARVAGLEKRLAGVAADKERLMNHCESYMASLQRMQEKERDARMELVDTQKECEGVKKKYADMKAKYKALKAACVCSWRVCVCFMMLTALCFAVPRPLPLRPRLLRRRQ